MTDVIRYSIILLCFIISLLIRLFKRTPFSILNLTLACTAMADIFLIFTDMSFVGIVLFMAVQICYSIAINNRFSIIYLLAAVFYFPLSIINLIKSFFLFLWGRRRQDISSVRFFAAISGGIFLLLLCDINVVLHNLPNAAHLIFQNNIPSFIDFLSDREVYNITGILIWSFYIPSQFLIVLSDFFIDDYRNNKNNQSA